MADAVEVAIESALLNRLVAMTISPAIPVALPNVSFTPPQPSQTAFWLRGTFLPADTYSLGVPFGSTNQHYGLFQVDVFYGQGGGELAPGRIATSVIEWFKRGTTLTKDSFSVKIVQPPYRRTMIKDDPWVMIPVFIPYIAYATNPA